VNIFPILAIVATSPLLAADLPAAEAPPSMDSVRQLPTDSDKPSTPTESADSDRQTDRPATRFVPREKVRADDAVSFPVDI
jgi:hypothetical protein